MGEVRLLLHRLSLFGAVGNGQTPHLIQHPLEDDEKALSAGVHHTGLLQHRVLIDGVGQGHLAGGDGLFQHELGAVVFGGGLGCGGGGQAGDGENGALGGLHDRLVGGPDPLVEGGGKGDTVGGVHLLQTFGYAPE